MTSATSGPTSWRQFAYFDPDGSCVRTWPAISLWGSEKFSGTLPRRGSMRSGAFFEHPTWAPPTDELACSSLLATPEAADGVGGRRATNLRWKNGTAYRPSGAKASISLRESLDLLPTPAAQEPGGTIEQYRARLAAHDGRASTFTPLSMLVETLLPTPRASPNENRQTKRTPSQEAGKHGLSLAAEVCSLLPTPKSTNNENRQSLDRYGPNLGMVLQELNGAATDPPSTDGPESSDDPHPTLWMDEDD